MILCRVVCIIFLFSAGHILAAQPDKRKTDPGPWSAGPAPDPGIPNTWNYVGQYTGGFVQAADKDSITLYWPEREFVRFRHDPLTGQQLEMKAESFPAIPAKKFMLGVELAKGARRIPEASDYSYRGSDVCVGDRVSIRFDRLNGVDICVAVRIDRRPGGRIPPAPGEKADYPIKHHERANADQEWEEKRVAYPDRYRPTYMGPDGKFYVGRYPSESFQIVVKLPVAPAPREVKSSSSPAKP